MELEDPALILYTSGTTGRPKGAVLSHGNITWNTVNQLAHVDLASTDVTICAAPLFHVTGLGQITMPTFFKGGTVVVVPKFEPGPFLELLEQRRATGFAAVPTMLQMICDHPDWERRDVSSLRYVVFGGSPVLARVAQKWLDRGVQVQQGYGLTEAAPGILMAVPEGIAEHPVSAGVPHFFTDTTLETPLRERIDGPGQGELLVRGPHVFTGYWDRPGDTAEAMSADGWLRTGDVVRVDEDGWAQVVDRVKDMIISGGENIYPAEVEAVIAELPGIDLVAVVGQARRALGRGRPRVRRPRRRRHARRSRTAPAPRGATGPLQDPAERRVRRRPPPHRDRKDPPRTPARTSPHLPTERPRMTIEIDRPQDLLTMIGEDLGTSEWLAIPQSDIDLFATATHDDQWIHTDVERARTGPFGGTIAHGYLTLSLLIPLWSSMLEFRQIDMAVNYGLNKVRFPTPVPAGSKVRLSATLAGAEDVGRGGIQATIDATMELDGSPKPACIAQMVHRYYQS